MKNKYQILFIILFTIKTFSQNGGLDVTNTHNISPIENEVMVCGSLFEFTPANTDPLGIAFDGTYFYVCQRNEPLIYKYTLTGVAAGTIPYPVATELLIASDMDFDGTNLWVMAEEQGVLYKLNPSNGAILSSFDITNLTIMNYYGCAYDNGFVWVTSYSEPQELIRVNATTGQVVNTFPLQGRFGAIKIINGGLYAINSDPNPDVISKIDKTTGAILYTLPWCFPFTLGITTADNHLWASSWGVGNGGLRKIAKFPLSLSLDEFADVSEIKINVFPNPANNNITVEATDKISAIDMFNALGESVFHSNHENVESVFLDISNFSNGIYFLKITTQQGVFAKKYIKL